MTLNNGWIICIIVYLVIVCIGIGVEVIARKSGRLEGVYRLFERRASA